MLNVSGVQGQVILQLYKSDNGKSENGKRSYAVVQEQIINQDGQVTFPLIPEGNTSLGRSWIPMAMEFGIPVCI